jgi:hypothetical protein
MDDKPGSQRAQLPHSSSPFPGPVLLENPTWSRILSFFLSFFFFLVVLGLELRAYTPSHSTSPFFFFFFVKGFLHNRILRTIVLAWL